MAQAQVKISSPLTNDERRDRRRARKAVFQVFYALDTASDWSLASARTHLAGQQPPLGSGAMRFAEQLTEAYFQQRLEIEERLDSVNPHWKTNRMGVPERNVLRVALAELRSGAQTPPHVVIAEANKLADTYGGPEQAGFVGGALTTIIGPHLRPVPKIA